MHLFSDRGTPASIRHLNAYSGHTYKFTKEDGTFKYIKVHIKTNIGVKNLNRETAEKLAGQEPDYLVKDLFDAIERGDYPTWNIYVQVMDPKEAESYNVNIFDMTKVWPHKDFPLRQIGRLTMNCNVSLPIVAFADTGSESNTTRSLATTLPTSSKRRFRRATWFPAGGRLLILVSLFCFYNKSS